MHVYNLYQKLIKLQNRIPIWAHRRCDVYKRVKTKFLQFFITLIFIFSCSILRSLSLCLSLSLSLMNWKPYEREIKIFVAYCINFKFLTFHVGHSFCTLCHMHACIHTYIHTYIYKHSYVDLNLKLHMQG